MDDHVDVSRTVWVPHMPCVNTVLLTPFECGNTPSERTDDSPSFVLDGLGDGLAIELEDDSAMLLLRSWMRRGGHKFEFRWKSVVMSALERRWTGHEYLTYRHLLGGVRVLEIDTETREVTDVSSVPLGSG